MTRMQNLGIPCPSPRGEGEKNTTLAGCEEAQPFSIGHRHLGDLLEALALDRWKQDQLLRIAHENPPQDGESFEDYADRCLVMHEKPVEEAASFGTRIHDSIEKFFEGEPIEDELLPYVKPAFRLEAGTQASIHRAGEDDDESRGGLCRHGRYCRPRV